jgi:NAD(P)-dependent dehydrogenase (short-subunit alcohol dehydrogenase family)
LIMDRSWSSDDILSQLGRVAIVTGASSGLGEETARVLAHKDAHVVMAVRDTVKGEKVATLIRGEKKNASISVMALDLCSLKSVEDFSDKFLNEYQRLDLLINNAGVMMCPHSTSTDGFEIQIGTNHFGHFALTGRLIDRLKSTEDSRVVAVSSIAHKGGKLNFDDIHWGKRNYNTIKAYCDSKLANLYFSYELARKLADTVNAPRIVAAHPGVCRTELTRHSKVVELMGKFMAQKQTVGALSLLRAATDPLAGNGDYYGPSGLFEMAGAPIKADSTERSKDESAARRLWELSEELTGVKY